MAQCVEKEAHRVEVTMERSLNDVDDRGTIHGEQSQRRGKLDQLVRKQNITVCILTGIDM